MNAVWITSTYPWADEPVGGIFFRTQARALARLGASITVVTPTPWAPWPLGHLRGKWRSYARAPRSSEDQGVRILRPSYIALPRQPSLARPDRFIAGAALRTRRRWPAADVIHGHYSITGLAAWRVARSTGLPLVLSFHGDDLNTWPDSHPDRMPEFLRALRDAALVTAVSLPLVDRIRALSGVEAVHLPIGCDRPTLLQHALPREQARDLLGLPHDRVIVLFVGQVHRDKGIVELVDATLRLDDRFLTVFVGRGPDVGRGSSDPRAHGRLDYRGQCENAEVVRYMSAADVLVLPSHREGLPTVLVESGILGLPVIASAVGGIPDLLADGRGTVLPEISSDAITQALLHFVARRDDAEVAAGRLRQHVRDVHDADGNAKHLLDLYRSVAKRADCEAPPSGPPHDHAAVPVERAHELTPS